MDRTPVGIADLRHQRREVRTALELAVVALAPASLVDDLALTAGYLEALVDLPSDAPAVVALAKATTERSRKALTAWSTWRSTRAPEKV